MIFPKCNRFFEVQQWVLTSNMQLNFIFCQTWLQRQNKKLKENEKSTKTEFNKNLVKTIRKTVHTSA